MRTDDRGRTQGMRFLSIRQLGGEVVGRTEQRCSWHRLWSEPWRQWLGPFCLQVLATRKPNINFESQPKAHFPGSAFLSLAILPGAPAWFSVRDCVGYQMYVDSVSIWQKYWNETNSSVEHRLVYTWLEQWKGESDTLPRAMVLGAVIGRDN